MFPGITTIMHNPLKCFTSCVCPFSPLVCMQASKDLSTFASLVLGASYEHGQRYTGYLQESISKHDGVTIFAPRNSAFLVTCGSCFKCCSLTLYMQFCSLLLKLHTMCTTVQKE